MKFCANISFMFTEYPFFERYELAKAAGFKAVESGFPFQFSLEDVVKTKCNAGLDQVLLNIYTGDVSKGELGCAAIPGKQKQFADSLETTVEYAKALNCKKIHLMSGTVDTNSDKIEQAKVYEYNMRYSASRLERDNIIGIVEPINSNTVPNYYMNSYSACVDIIKKINSPHLRLMLDIFHLQQIQGNISSTIATVLPYVGHVQIAQVPARNEPNTAGELDYRYVLQYLDKLGYHDWIGLEYKPAAGTLQGLSWINEFGYQL